MKSPKVNLQVVGYETSMRSETSKNDRVAERDKLVAGLFPQKGDSAYSLLTVLLSDRAQATKAWEDWRTRHDFDDLDQGSHRLLIMALPTLDRYDLEVPDRARLQGLARRTFCNNAMLWSATSEMASLFETSGIPLILMSGLPLSASIYKPGERYSIDADVLVKRADYPKAQDLLAASDRFEPKYPGRLYHRDYDNGEEWRRGSARVDLHARPCHEFSQDAALETALWDSARSIQQLPSHVKLPPNVLVPSPEHVVVHLAVGQTRSDRLPHGDVDIFRFIQQHSAEFDWDALAEIAARRSMSLRVSCVLSYLSAQFSLPVPEMCLAQMTRQAHAFEWTELRRIAKQGRWPVLDWYRFMYRRERCSTHNGSVGVLSVARFLYKARGARPPLEAVYKASRLLLRTTTQNQK